MADSERINVTADENSSIIKGEQVFPNKDQDDIFE